MRQRRNLSRTHLVKLEPARVDYQALNYMQMGLGLELLQVDGCFSRFYSPNSCNFIGSVYSIRDSYSLTILRFLYAITTPIKFFLPIIRELENVSRKPVRMMHRSSL